VKEPNNDVAVGPSLAWARVDRRSDFMAGLDFTYFTKSTSPFFPLYWVSAGLRTASATGPAVVLPYAEAGGWLLFNVGIGYSAAIRAESSTHYAHLFLGLPLYPFPIVEPYYRPAFRLGGAAAPTIHELGLLLKWSTYRL
jgi:hypothetical protein